MNNFVIKDGKPVFVGKEDPSNPPTRPQNGSTMECPVCHGQFPYLVGEDTSDGGRIGCEGCWKPGKPSKSSDAYDKSHEML